MAGFESAGILLFRRIGGNNDLEVFIVHPGGPFFAKRDEGVWSIPKGLPESGEELVDTALREFEEEVGFRPDGELIPLGTVLQSGGKTVHAFACEHPADRPVPGLRSNTFTMEWPPKSGKTKEFPEVDRGGFYPPEIAARKLNRAQVELIERLIALAGERLS